MKPQSKTDWDRVKRDAEADAPIPFDPAVDPYDPNDAAAVDAFWADATVTHRARQSRRKGNAMKMETIKKRLAKDRPMISVTLRMPEDVVDDLKRLAPLRGFSGYQALMRAYVGVGLRDDLDRFEQSDVARLLEKLRERGVPEETLNQAAAQVLQPA